MSVKNEYWIYTMPADLAWLPEAGIRPCDFTAIRYGAVRMFPLRLELAGFDICGVSYAFVLVVAFGLAAGFVAVAAFAVDCCVDGFASDSNWLTSVVYAAGLKF